MKSSFKFDPESGTIKPVAQTRNTQEETPAEPPKDNAATTTSMDLRRAAIAPNIPTDDEDIVKFREKSDYTIFQILDEDTHRVLGYIGGYALDISFNLQELRSVSRIEEFLEALQRLFRKIIADQILGQKDKAQ